MCYLPSLILFCVLKPFKYFNVNSSSFPLTYNNRTITLPLASLFLLFLSIFYYHHYIYYNYECLHTYYDDAATLTYTCISTTNYVCLFYINHFIKSQPPILLLSVIIQGIYYFINILPHNLIGSYLTYYVNNFFISRYSITHYEFIIITYIITRIPPQPVYTALVEYFLSYLYTIFFLPVYVFFNLSQRFNTNSSFESRLRHLSQQYNFNKKYIHSKLISNATKLYIACFSLQTPNNIVFIEYYVLMLIALADPVKTGPVSAYGF